MAPKLSITIIMTGACASRSKNDISRMARSTCSCRDCCGKRRTGSAAGAGCMGGNATRCSRSTGRKTSNCARPSCAATAMHSLDRFSLGGRRAIVTGASRGIGAAIAAGLADAGAEVFGLSRSGTAPTNVTPIACDLADDAALRRAIDGFAAAHDRLDILVNAAAVSLPASGASGELDRFRQTIATDLTGVYATILAAYPLLKKAGNSSVINVTSINSVRGFPGNPGYAPAK